MKHPSHKQEQLLASIASAPEFLPDFTKGLSSEQVASRLNDGLSNKSPKKVTKTYWQIFCDNFFSFFNILLFTVAGLMIWAGLSIKYYFFLGVLFCNIIIGLYCDIHARHLVDKLRLISDQKVKVVRDGEEQEVDVNDVVLSDIINLKAGEQIVADAIVLEGHLKIDESLITGEVEPVEKQQGDQIYSGSIVHSGQAYVRVNKVGIANFAESLQNSAKSFERPKSELKRSCLIIFWVTGVISILIGLAMTLIWRFSSNPEPLKIFMMRMSGSMVAMIPSGLYLLTSLTLATGVVSLAKKHMNVQELYCIEMLARVDVICFDKTGTLTDGKLGVRDFYGFSDYSDDEVKGYVANIVKSTHDDNSTAQAIKEAYISNADIATSVIPFDSAYKYSAVSFVNGGTWIMGANEFVDAKSNVEAENRISQMASRGYRVLSVFHNKKPIKDHKIPDKNDLVGLIIFSDHIKSDAKANITWFKENGVEVKVISGDDPITVSEIANQVGVPNAAQYISMDKFRDEDIPELLKNYSVFGRVTPEQKALLVEALQHQGHKVAMTGDGVNDIIALKKADCSIAMASGSSAARNVAHMVSVDNDFSKLPDVVKEGRRVINNLQRTASLFLSKTFFAIVVSLMFIISSSLGHASYPFSTSNMMVWEIVTIGGGGFFLALQPSNERLSGSFMKNVLGNAAPAGIVEVLSVVVIYVISLTCPDFLSLPVAQTMSVITFTAISYLVLFRICWPFDKYRNFVFWGLTIIGGVFFLIDILVPSSLSGHSGVSRSLFFDLDYQDLNWQLILIMAGIFIAMALIYGALDYLARRFVIGEKKEKTICVSTKK